MHAEKNLMNPDQVNVLVRASKNHATTTHNVPNHTRIPARTSGTTATSTSRYTGPTQAMTVRARRMPRAARWCWPIHRARR
ncbi:MAG: hypothetical protein FWE61_00875, partial [Micrococcales bacterium]|nr:hypothetical protein [Micrococcales bacterium]